MAKTLRLGFVMGGGVSLGTFSGAALSETIKQQIVYGQYDTGKKDENGQPIYVPYDKVELDVFSGASAGAIALAIMIRMLTNPKDKYRFLGWSSYKELEIRLEEKLDQQFGEKLLELKANYPIKYQQLLAAQTVQEFQEKVWAREVDVERFLGVGGYYKDLTDNPSLLDRTIIDELGRDLFQFKQYDKRLDNRALLGDRVLFACTLANLSHTLRKSKRTAINDDQKPSLIKALNDSSVDKIHSELRVFDLNFKEIDPSQGRYYPLKWMQYHAGESVVMNQEDSEGKVYKKKIGSLNINDTWRELAATAIASAAVPFAFEPVVLNRYDYEFGAEWAEELRDKTQHPFTYVDGGVFNNEPIKEAMRLASYIDTTNPDKNFERQLIFVDPDVSELENQFRISAHEKLSVGRSLFSGQSKVGAKPTLLRLASKLSYVLSAVLNEAQSIEVGRVAEVLEQFERRKHLRKFYRSAATNVPTDADIIAMRDYIAVELDKRRTQLSLPNNTLQIQHEFIRICNEEAEFLGEYLPIKDERELIDKINEFVYIPTPSQVENASYWVFVMSCLSLDIAMGLIAKRGNTVLIPIAPFDFYTQKDEYSLMKLPGGSMAGFAGFASHEASAYEVKYGKYCAMRILQELNLTRGAQQDLPLPSPFDYRKFDTVLKTNLKTAIVKRIKEMVPNSVATIMPFLEGYLNENVQNFVDKNLEDNIKTSSFEFRIQVPNDALVLRGFHPDGRNNTKKNLKPVYIKGEYYFITKVDFDFDKKEWKGDYTNFMQNIYIDKEKLFEDVPRLSLELPVMSMESEAYLSPNPIFTVDARSSLGMGSYTELTAKNWEYISDIEALDEKLWGKDEWKGLMDS